MLVDLHVHSGYSSGTQTLEQIVDEARDKGISMISITDDDSREETIAAIHAAGGKAVLPGGYLPDAESLRAKYGPRGGAVGAQLAMLYGRPECLFATRWPGSLGEARPKSRR